jgi:class 3 adenylate cyclase/tetratricopeptide (TPR) repeat protein
MLCPVCASAVPEGARFCPSCGHRLDVRGDERRVVTVLFADLVGFTGYSEGRDPEAVKNLVDNCFQRLARDIDAYGGQVDKVMGDAVIALFGAPVAHEDDAERAVRAALQMQHSIADYALETGVPVRLRIGVNTGEVLVGAVRAGADADYTAMGDVVNTASRLETTAQPGQVLVGPGTHAATKDVVRYHPIGAVAVRGREEPVEAYVAVEVTSLPGYRPRRTATELVGRDAEVGLLRHALALSLTRRRPQFVLVAGDAGIGKQRVAEEATRTAALDHGAIVVTGRCVPYGEATGWWPVAELLRGACGIQPDDQADDARAKCRLTVASAFGLPEDDAQVVAVTAGLMFLMGEQHALSELEPVRARNEATRTGLAFFEALARQWPLVLVVSELHWADEVVLEFIDRLFDRLGNLPFALLATSRPGLADRWLPSVGRANVVFLQLDPLDRPALAQLLRELLGRPPVPDLVEFMFERTGGNPLFVEEVVNLLDDAGVLEAVGRGDVATARGLSELPATLRGLVTARLDGLTRPERSLLEDAVVIGAHGSLDILRALARLRGEQDIAQLLHRLEDKEMLVVVDGEFHFKSDVVRDVAYETLTKADRARRHAGAAEWLVELGQRTGRGDELALQVAHHYGTAAAVVHELGHVDGLGDVRSRAADALRQAATWAFDREDAVSSIQVVEQALRLVGDEDTPVRRSLLVRRGRAHTMLGELARARADLEEARAGAIAAGDAGRPELATALTALGELARREGRHEESLAVTDEALALWREIGEPVGLADALRTRGMTLLFSGDGAAAEVAITEALDVSRELGDRRGVAWALQNLAWITFQRGDADSADARLHESADMFAEIGDWFGFGWALGLLAWVRYFQGRFDDARQLADSLLPHLREAGDRWAVGMMTVLDAALSLWTGHATTAVEQAEDARQQFQLLEDRWGETQAVAVLARAYVMCGRVQEGLATADELLGLGDDLPDLRLFTQVVAGATATHAGEAERACALFAGVTSAPDEPRPRAAEIATSEGLARLEIGDVAGALKALDQCRTDATTPGLVAALDSVLFLALAAAGRIDEIVDFDGEVGAAASFLDRARLDVALGCAAVQRGDEAAAEDAFERARERLELTDDRFDQAVVVLAHGLARAALGREGADDLLVYARTRLAGMGVGGQGWETLLSLALTGGTGLPASVAAIPSAAPR